MRAWREGKNFREAIYSDPEITSRVPRKTLGRAFDLQRQLRNIDKIFVRVFGKEVGKGKSLRIAAATARGEKRSVKR
jgi:hypothetical protein